MLQEHRPGVMKETKLYTGVGGRENNNDSERDELLVQNRVISVLL